MSHHIVQMVPLVMLFMYMILKRIQFKVLPKGFRMILLLLGLVVVLYGHLRDTVIGTILSFVMIWTMLFL